ncbi:DUF1616 domain-containing protein [Natrialbaceae archaeon AArc-T1-2]|uniref:DUF1616 domain-containing protein n=1 Tax=Natrialbaceae archaeon AArc-T1-2 TaxID=3053904 RepID=UPI0031F331FA
MSLRETTVSRLASVRRYPTDLAAVSLAAGLAYYVVTSYGAGSELRFIAAIPLILFFPGYALVSVLFPAAPRASRRSRSTSITNVRPRGVDVVERLGLALALSIAIVPVAGIVLSATGWGLEAESAAAAFAFVAIVFSQLAVVRRIRLPVAERFTVPLTTVLGPLYRARGESAVATATSILLVLAIVAAGVTLAAAFVSPQSASEFTELGLYTEDDGELVAGQFPSSVEPGESIPVVVGIENHEGEPREYTVVVQQQTVEDGTVTDRTTLEAVPAQVDDGEAMTIDRAITPTATDDTVRIVVLLYDDDPPAEPTRENALEDTFFWVTVDGGDGDEDEGEAEGEDADAEAEDEDTDDAESEDEDTDDAEAEGEDTDDAEAEDEDTDDAETEDDDADDVEAEEEDTDDEGEDGDDAGIDDVEDGASSLFDAVDGLLTDDE